MRSNEVSSTALTIAASAVFSSSEPGIQRFVPPLMAERSRWFVAATPGNGRIFRFLLKYRLFRPLIRLAERLLLPGIQLHYLLRKRFIEDTVRTRLQAGVRQVVVLGAGFDTLALQLVDEYQTVSFFEIDHPATQGVKTKTLRDHPVTEERLHFLPGNIAEENIVSILSRSCEFHKDRDTVFVAEGLLMYFSEEIVASILAAVRQAADGNTGLVFTCMEREGDGRIAFEKQSRVIDRWLSLREEKFQWGLSRREMPDFLQHRGFALEAIAHEPLLRDLYLKPARLAGLPLAKGEYICVANAERTMTSLAAVSQ